MTVRGGRYWLTPPDLELEVRKLLGGSYFDPCPYPRKWDALVIDWERPWYCNPPFIKEDGGSAAFSRKAVSVGGPGVFVTSIPTPVATLLRGRARFVDARRIAWLEVDTKKQMPSPGLTGIFYLPRPDVYTDSGGQQNDSPIVPCLHQEALVRVPIPNSERSSSEPPSGSTPTDSPKLIQYSGSPPRCGNCGAPVNTIYARKGAGGTHWCKVGHLCLYCGQPYVDKHLVENANRGWYGRDDE